MTNQIGTVDAAAKQVRVNLIEAPNRVPQIGLSVNEQEARFDFTLLAPEALELAHLLFTALERCGYIDHRPALKEYLGAHLRLKHSNVEEMTLEAQWEANRLGKTTAVFWCAESEDYRGPRTYVVRVWREGLAPDQLVQKFYPEIKDDTAEE